MTEQIEDDFWAAERARDTAARGRQADPGACGTCRDRVQASGQVAHDECAQRATLLPAPDAPAWELITGLSEEELAELPPRFHIPAFVEPTRSWVCAVCWGDGWSTQWPCKPATEQGLRVFTDEHQAETAAKRQTARIAELEAQLAEMTHLRDNALRALYRDDVELDIDLEETIAAPFYGPGWDWDESDLQPVVREAANAVRPAFGKLTQQRDKARDELAELQTNFDTAIKGFNASAMEITELRERVTELETERKRYGGVEPTIAEEMAYLSSCLDAVHQVCDQAVRRATRWENPLPIPEWVETVRQAADGVTEAVTTRPALPWARLMDADDLAEFLAELEHAIATPGATPDEALAAVEKACADWRTPGHGLRGDEPGTAGP